MTVGVLIVSHENIGDSLLNTAVKILGDPPLLTRVLAVSFTADPDAIQSRIAGLVKELDTGDGVLILTDLYGATPSNVAHRFAEQAAIKIINGINLPMLIRVLNHHQMNLAELADTAIIGGREGILCNRRSRG